MICKRSWHPVPVPGLCHMGDGLRGLAPAVAWESCSVETRLPKGIACGLDPHQAPGSTTSGLALQTPTLIMFGELDHTLARESLQQLHHLPNHSVVKLYKAGHACYLHSPEAFHHALLEFLDHLP